MCSITEFKGVLGMAKSYCALIIETKHTELCHIMWLRCHVKLSNKKIVSIDMLR